VILKKRLLLSVSLLGLILTSGGCRDRQSSASKPGARKPREQAEFEASQALAKSPEEIRRRIYGAEIEVPGTGTTVHLAGGRGAGPGAPPAWSVELRRVAGVVPGSRGMDVYVDLAIQRALTAPDCYLALFHLDSTTTTYAAAVPIGEGARIVQVKARKAKGDAYTLEVEYIDRAPQGDFMSNPSAWKRRRIKVANHLFLGTSSPSAVPHP
jgi:hypothetical protein